MSILIGFELFVAKYVVESFVFINFLVFSAIPALLRCNSNVIHFRSPRLTFESMLQLTIAFKSFHKGVSLYGFCPQLNPLTLRVNETLGDTNF